MSRVNPLDIDLTRGLTAYKAGSTAGFADLHVTIPATGHACSKCGKAMQKHGSYSKKMAHVVGNSPCKLTVKVPRHLCEKCGKSASEPVPFASASSPSITDVLEAHIVWLLRQRQTISEAAMLCDVPYDTVRLVIDGVKMSKPKLPTTVLMDEIHAYSYREEDTGKLVAVYWACIYDGKDGKLVDVLEGRESDVIDAWFRQFDPDERKAVQAFCCDLHGTRLDAAKRRLPMACRRAGRFHMAKAGLSHMDDARKRRELGAGNGAAIKRRARKLGVNRGKRRREHPGEKWVETEKRIVCDVLAVCDAKHSLLRQAYLVLQLYYIWQDQPWTDREQCDKDLCNWIMKASGVGVAEMNSFAGTVNRYRQQLVSGTILGVNSARAESTNDKIKELKRRSRGFGGYDEARKRLLVAFGKPSATEGATERKRRLEAAKARRTAPKKHKRRKRR